MKWFNSWNTIKKFSYHIYSPQNLVDPWVAKAMEIWDPVRHERLSEFSKSGATMYEVEEILEQIYSEDRNFSPELDLMESEALRIAELNTLGRFQKAVGRVEPVTLEKAMERMHHDTSAGASFLGFKKGAVLPEIYKKASEIFLNAKIGKQQTVAPTMVATRGHLHHFTSKKRRLTFIVPAEIIALEMMFVRPITDKLLENQKYSPMMFGKNLLVRLRDLIRKQYGPKSAVASLDFSSFDRTVPVFLLRRAFAIVRELIDFDHWEGVSLRPSEVKRYSRVLDMLEEYFINTPVMSPSGKLLIIEGMVKSGSGFTQLIDSIVSTLIVEMICAMSGLGIADLHVLGDDQYVALGQYPNLDSWSERIGRWFRMKLNVEKTRLFSGQRFEKEFLGYTWVDGFLHRKTFDLFNMLIHPASVVDSLEKSVSRFIAYMFLGGVNDLEFCKFFEFYQSCYDINGEMEYVEDFEARRKRVYGGQEIPRKKIIDYTKNDFLYGLLTVKD
jgi:hypothetical protein